MSELHTDAYAVTIVQTLPGGRGRRYSTAVGDGDPRGLIEAALDEARQRGGVIDAVDGGNPYAVLDVLDGNGEVVQDFGIPDREALEWWVRLLGVTIESEDTAPTFDG
ncbi:MAG TPA: hypothetical protein VIP77_24595 [Jiangellaceae bacterium]